MNNHYDVSKYLNTLTKDEVIKLGGRLGLSYTDLCNMTSPVSDNMVADWLRGKHNVLNVDGKPSWSSLINALEDISHSGVAYKICDDLLSHASI